MTRRRQGEAIRGQSEGFATKESSEQRDQDTSSETNDN